MLCLDGELKMKLTARSKTRKSRKFFSEIFKSEISKIDKIDLNYGDRFEKLRVLFTRRSLKKIT